MHTLCKQGVNKVGNNKEETKEVPVIVDDVTKWISGVNERTTCRDIITAILEKEYHSFQVWSKPYLIYLNSFL